VKDITGQLAPKILFKNRQRERCSYRLDYIPVTDDTEQTMSKHLN